MKKRGRKYYIQKSNYEGNGQKGDSHSYIHTNKLMQYAYTGRKVQESEGEKA